MTTEVKNAVEQAEKNIRDLEDQKENVLGRTKALANQRQQISHAAYTGNAKAKQTLDKLNAETGLMDLELENITAAIREAHRILDAAQGSEAQAADRDAALRLQELNKKFLEMGLILDDAFADIISAATEMKETLDKMHQLGSHAPSYEQLRVLGAIAVKTALMSIPCGWSKEFEMVPPNQRRSFKSLVSGWHDQIESNVAARLGDEKEKAA